MNDFFDRHLTRPRVLAILRGYSPADTVRLCEHAVACGVGLIEVPVQDAGAYPSLTAAVEWGRDRSIPVGAGTVTTVEALRAVHAIGAAFSVAPGFDAEVIEASRSLELPHLPGVSTPTDIQAASRAGSTWVKAFPAAVLGTDWLRAVRAPFPDIRLVATGGVTMSNASEFLAAGASAVALGSSLADSSPEVIRLLRLDDPSPSPA